MTGDWGCVGDAYDYAKKGVKKIAETLYKRWDKTILSWDGKQKSMNLYRFLVLFLFPRIFSQFDWTAPAQTSISESF